VWKAYDDAQQQLAQRYEEVAGTKSADGSEPQPPTQEQQRHLDLIVDLEERVEQLRQRDWEAYGSDLKAAVEAAARRRTGMQVPTIVTIHLDHSAPPRTGTPGRDRT